MEIKNRSDFRKIKGKKSNIAKSYHTKVLTTIPYITGVQLLLHFVYHVGYTYLIFEQNNFNLQDRISMTDVIFSWLSFTFIAVFYFKFACRAKCFSLIKLNAFVLTSAVTNSILAYHFLGYYAIFSLVYQISQSICWMILSLIYYQNGINDYIFLQIGMEPYAKKIVYLYYRTKDFSIIFACLVLLLSVNLICQSLKLEIQIGFAIYAVFCFIVSNLISYMLENEKFQIGIILLFIEWIIMVCWLLFYGSMYTDMYDRENWFCNCQYRMEIVNWILMILPIACLTFCIYSFMVSRKYFYGRFSRIVKKIKSKNVMSSSNLTEFTE